MRRVVLIAGTTASGKSGLAMAIAKARDGVIINADSMQVYRELRILTARPSPADEQAIPHRMYGHVTAAEPYSVGLWLDDVAREIDNVRRQNKLPIVVGGTGLYFKALTEGLSPVPPIADDIRARWRSAGEALSAEDLFGELTARDPLTAQQLRVRDRQRVVRALEVIDATGRALADWQKESGPALLGPDEWVGVVVDRPREDIYGRCNARFDEMMRDGALQEVDSLLQMQLEQSLPAMRALGVGPLMAYLQHGSGDADLESAVAQSKTATRRFVKRQLTWMRRNMIAWNILFPQEMERQGDNGFPFIDF